MPVPRKPCKACPWVTTNTAADIPDFDADKAENLAGTCPDERGYGPDFGAPIMSCHEALEGREMPCAGWLATVGERHPSMRLAVMQGRLDPSRLSPEPDWPQLHEDFSQMIDKLRRTR